MISYRLDLKTSVKNEICLVQNRVKIWRTGRHNPAKEFPGVPPDLPSISEEKGGNEGAL